MTIFDRMQWRKHISLRLVVSLLVLHVCTALPVSAAERDANRHGIAVVIGGALKTDNAEVWSRLVALSGGRGATWLVFPTASSTPEKSAQAIIASLKAHGAKAEMVPLSKALKNHPIADVVQDPAWLAKIDKAGGIYFAGGAQALITDALYARAAVADKVDKAGGVGKAEFKRTPMLAAIWRMFQRGGVVAGSSAGAAIMSETMFRDPADMLTILRQGAHPGTDIDRGLGFVGARLFVDQHFLKRGRIGRMLPVMAQTGYKLGLGIEENTAAIVEGDDIEIVGARGALLVDLIAARHPESVLPEPVEGLGHTRGSLGISSPSTSSGRTVHTDRFPTKNTSAGAVFKPFSAENALLTYLDRGDKYNLATGVVKPSAAKISGTKIDPNAASFKPYNKTVGFYADILGDGTIINAMTSLLDSPAAEVRGLAFEFSNHANTNNASSAAPGFEFRLYKTRDTFGYFSSASGGEDYTVIRMALDVTPVSMASPLYKPFIQQAMPSASTAGENDEAIMPANAKKTENTK